MLRLSRYTDRELIYKLFDNHPLNVTGVGSLNNYVSSKEIFDNEEKTEIVKYLLSKDLIENVSYAGFKLTVQGQNVYFK